MSATTATKTLVVGHYPPSPNAGAAETVDMVRQLVERGDDVEVLSPEPSAAHHSAHLVGIRGAVALAARARGHQRVVLRVSPGLFLRTGANRVQWLADAGLLTLVLRRGPDVTLVMDDLRWFPIGGRASRQLWAEAEHIVVRSSEDATKLEAEGGVPASKIEIQPAERPAARWRTAPIDDSWGVAAGEPTVYADVMEQIRSRATADRRLAEAASAPVVEDALPSPQSPTVVAAKQLFRRVLGSYADPVINALRRTG